MRIRSRSFVAARIHSPKMARSSGFGARYRALFGKPVAAGSSPVAKKSADRRVVRPAPFERNTMSNTEPMNFDPQNPEPTIMNAPDLDFVGEEPQVNDLEEDGSDSEVVE